MKIDLADFEPIPLDLLRRESRLRALEGEGEDSDVAVLGAPAVRVEVRLPQWVRTAISQGAKPMSQSPLQP